MIKKILLWSLYAAFVGLIIFGAIYRSNAKLEDEAPARESSQGQSENINRNQTSGRNSETTAEHVNEPVENTAYPISTIGVLTTAVNSTQVLFQGDSEHEWVTLSGVVESITTRSLTLTLDEGASLIIERRPWRFAQENGFMTSVGNQIQVVGFYEEDLFQAAQIHDLTTDLLVQLRDETGHPLWASE